MAVWHQNFEHRGRSTAESGFNEQRFGGVVEDPAERQRPLLCQAGHQLGQPSKPLPVAGSERLVANHGRYLGHSSTMPGPYGGASRRSGCGTAQLQPRALPTWPPTDPLTGVKPLAPLAGV